MAIYHCPLPQLPHHPSRAHTPTKSTAL
jgi:hypothetical protein